MIKEGERCDLTDDEVDRICEEAEQAAVHSVHISGTMNPYTDPARAEVWKHAFRSAYARENGY